MKSTSLTFSLFFVIFFSNISVAQTLRSEPAPFSQDAVGEASCGPTSLFYAMRLGRDPRWSLLYESLRGAGEYQKVSTLVSEYGFAPNGLGSPRYDANGVWLHDLGEMLGEVAGAAGVQADHYVEVLERKEEEQRPRRMLERIHSRFKELAEKGSPAILLLRSILKNHDAAAGTFSWDRVGGHFVVFKDVQRELREDEQGFTIQILDPQTGQVQTIYIRRNNFRLCGRRGA